MSELKAYIAPTPDGTGLADYYLKSEADKVIAELDRQIKFLKITHDSCGNCNRCANGMGKVFDESLNKPKEQLRHHKYKRCLAMANWCMTEYLHSKCLDFTNTEQWYWRRWHIRWRNLAKKFKEAK